MTRYATTVGVAALLALGLAALAWNPPDLLRVGANYSAKILCSSVFVAGRPAPDVLDDDIQAPGNPILRLLATDIDQDQQVVRAGFLGFIGRGLAVYRPGTGCAAVPDGDLARASQFRVDLPPAPPPSDQHAWPQGTQADPQLALQARVIDPALAGPGARAIAVIHRGRLVAESYAPDFDRDTPLLGWSMTKTVTALLVGMQIQDGRLALDRAGFWPAPDSRSRITLADLLAMSSGLRFNEGYGDVSDVTRMLYLEPDMAAFVRSLPPEGAIGSIWNYSSGTSTLLARIWQEAAGPDALSFPQRRLFQPLGLSSAVLEADARGTYVGSSYLYATAQDWARLGQFLLQEGVWNGERLLPEGYVEHMRQVAPASKGQYGKGQVWRWGPEGDTPEGQNPDLPFNLPDDTYWMLGHDGQSVAIVPSRELVVVRLGLTPARLHYKPQALLAAIIRALEPDR